MDKNKLKTLGDAWKVMDERYDNTILELLNASDPTLSQEKLDELKNMQDKLFDLEAEIFKYIAPDASVK